MLITQQRLVAEVAKIFLDAVFYKQTTQRVISLTIDDGTTPDELDDRSMQIIYRCDRRIQSTDRKPSGACPRHVLHH